MDLFYQLITGLVVGWVAAEFMRRNSSGVIIEIVVGAAGALAGGFLYDTLDISLPVRMGNVLFAASGATVSIFLSRVFMNS